MNNYEDEIKKLKYEIMILKNDVKELKQKINGIIFDGDNSRRGRYNNDL